MAFRYINPGYGALTGNSSVTTIESFIYNPQNGVSFDIVQTEAKNLNVPLSQNFSNDIYGKFNLYLSSSASTANYFSLGAPSTKSASYPNGKCLGITIYDSAIYLLDGQGNRIGTGISLLSNVLNKIWFHLHKGDNYASTYCELIVNNSESNVDNIYLEPFSSNKYFIIYNNNASTYSKYLSELIISDEYISPREKIVALPIDTTETTMTADANGIYIADAVNQTLLQTPDVDALLTNYGATSQVTGIALVGNPAYRTGEGISSLIGLSKANGVITEHDSCTLDTVSSAVIMDGWSLSNTTIDDLQNMQFGWKAGN